MVVPRGIRAEMTLSWAGGHFSRFISLETMSMCYPGESLDLNLIQTWNPMWPDPKLSGTCLNPFLSSISRTTLVLPLLQTNQAANFSVPNTSLNTASAPQCLSTGRGDVPRKKDLKSNMKKRHVPLGATYAWLFTVLLRYNVDRHFCRHMYHSADTSTIKF